MGGCLCQQPRAMWQGYLWVGLLASFPVVWHHSLTCDLALALLLFPPLSSGSLLHLSPQLIYQGPLRTRLQRLLRNGRFCARSWSPSCLPRETCLWPCARPAAVTNPSLRPGTHCFLFCVLYLLRISNLFVFDRWMYWDGICVCTY